MVKICSCGPECMVIADELSRGQAERIAEAVREILEEDRIMAGKTSDNGLGTRNLIPLGPFRGLTVEDVFLQYDFRGIGDLLRCIPALTEAEGSGICNPVFFQIPYPHIILLNNEILLYTAIIVLNVTSSPLPLSLSEFLDCFRGLLCGTARELGFGSEAGILPAAMPEERQRSLLKSIVLTFQVRLMKLLTDVILPEEKIFDCGLKITDGIYGGMKIRDVFLTDRNRGLAHLLCSVRKMKDGENLYTAVVQFVLVILRSREYLSFEEFLSAYGLFFPAENPESLLSQGPDEQEKAYARLSADLGRRMLNSLNQPEPVQAA